MKLERISEQEAQKYIVYGKDQGFSMIEPCGILMTIYHRIYEGKRYHIGAYCVTAHLENGEKTQVTAYYILDELEVIQLTTGMEEDYFEKKQSKSV